jgi:hypothetical protein
MSFLLHVWSKILQVYADMGSGLLGQAVCPLQIKRTLALISYISERYAGGSSQSAHLAGVPFAWLCEEVGDPGEGGEEIRRFSSAYTPHKQRAHIGVGV